MARNPKHDDEAADAEAPLPDPGPEIDPNAVSVDPNAVSVDPNAPPDIDPNWSGPIMPGTISDSAAFEQAVADGRVGTIPSAPRYVVAHTVVGPAWTRGQYVPVAHGLEDSQIRRLLRIGAIVSADSPEGQAALANPHRLGLDEED